MAARPLTAINVAFTFIALAWIGFSAFSGVFVRRGVPPSSLPWGHRIIADPITFIVLACFTSFDKERRTACCGSFISNLKRWTSVTPHCVINEEAQAIRATLLRHCAPDGASLPWKIAR